MIDSFFGTESIIKITLVIWWICSFGTFLAEVQVEIKYSFIHSFSLALWPHFTHLILQDPEILYQNYFYIFCTFNHEAAWVLGTIPSAWNYETEIMGEINQVVPNLISESISGEKNLDGTLQRQIYQPRDVSGAWSSLIRNVISSSSPSLLNLLT